MTDLENCCERYERKYGEKAIEDGKPKMHFCEVLATELRKSEKKVVENSLNMQEIEHQIELQKIIKLLKE